MIGNKARSIGKFINNKWKLGRRDPPLSLQLRIKFALRLLTYLSFSDWDRTSFSFRIIPVVFDPKMQYVENIVNCMDHQDFAKNLVRRRQQFLREHGF